MIDPKFEEYYEWSPYNYTGNNPILRIDINGEGWGLLVKAGRALLKTGKRVYKSYKKSGKLDLKKNTVETIKETFDNVSTLADGKLDSEDVFAAIDLATGFGGEAKKLFKGGTKGGKRAGKNFTKKGKTEVIDANKEKNSGNTVCEDCDTKTVPAKKSQKGVTPPKNETQVDHIYPKSKGGDGDPSNGQVLCRDCNRKKGNKTPDEHYKDKGGN